MGARRRRRPTLVPIGHWLPGEFLSASWGVGDPQYGWLSRGLAITKTWDGSPKGRRPPAYSVTHCGTGHRVCMIEAHEGEAFKIADQLAELGDWSFDGLYGWRNSDPDLADKFEALCIQHGKKIRVGGGTGDQAAAQAIAYARAG